ncbi:hypothetical protein N0824_03439 [Microcystis sp. 0824]|nr:hypothetical protein N0824_03439 [Microcystis sp. 0824]
MPKVRPFSVISAQWGVLSQQWERRRWGDHFVRVAGVMG